MAPKALIKDKGCVPPGRLALAWVLAGLALVGTGALYSIAGDIPSQHIPHNEVIQLLQGICFSIAALWLASTAGIDLKLKATGYGAVLRRDLKAAAKYFGLALLVIGVVIGAAYLALRLGLYTLGDLENISAGAAAQKALGKQYLQGVIARSPLKLLIYLFASCVLIPIEEEIFFRRFLYVFLRKKLALPLALVISSAAFGAVHMGGALIPSFIYGLYLAWIYEREQSLPVSIMVHSANNFLVVLSMLLM